MFDVKRTFQERANEINSYFNFINTYVDKNKDENLNKILKSNLILMLYNLIESSMSNAIEEIHNNIHANSTSFNMLNIPLKEKIISLIKKKDTKEFVLNVNDLAIDIVKRSFDKQKVFSGNVDSKKIKELSQVYGFSTITSYAETKNGECLVNIKGKRNDLAHGVFSFAEIGKDYSMEDLEKMKNESRNYLDGIINNIENYLINQQYKKLEPSLATDVQ